MLYFQVGSQEFFLKIVLRFEDINLDLFSKVQALIFFSKVSQIARKF